MDKKFRLLELLLLWEGAVTAKKLCDHFSISRTTSQNIISEYRLLYPANLVSYDPAAKAHCPSNKFQPRYASKQLSDYLSFYPDVISDPHNVSENNDAYIDLLPRLERNDSPNVVRPIIRAIKLRLRLDISYFSVSSGITESRIISPHSLVFDGIRWHTRAYCERSQGYRDFVLSRFDNDPVFEDKSASMTKEHDDEWNKILTLVIQPDPRLRDSQRKAIELDYKMSGGKASIICRAALIKYLLQKLRLDNYHHSPAGQQIVVEQECWQLIEPYRMN